MEIWKDIAGYEGLYQVSNKGAIKIVKNGKIRKQTLAANGYLRVGLRKNGVTKIYTSHRLVAEAFIDNPLNKSFVNHINFIKTDNSVENLEWCTTSENLQHSIRAGRLVVAGERSGKAKLSLLQVRQIRRDGHLGMKTLAKKYGVCQSNIHSILSGQTWKELM